MGNMLASGLATLLFKMGFYKKNAKVILLGAHLHKESKNIPGVHIWMRNLSHLLCGFRISSKDLQRFQFALPFVFRCRHSFCCFAHFLFAFASIFFFILFGLFSCLLHFVGLDNAGKTSLLHRMTTGSFKVFTPTQVQHLMKVTSSAIVARVYPSPLSKSPFPLSHVCFFVLLLSFYCIGSVLISIIITSCSVHGKIASR